MNKISKRELIQEYNLSEETNYKSIVKFRKDFNFNDNEDAYNFLQNHYANKIKQGQELFEKFKKEKQIKKENRKFKSNYNKLISFLRNPQVDLKTNNGFKDLFTLTKSRVNINKPFSVKFKSYLGLSHVFKFNNREHYFRWSERVIDNKLNLEDYNSLEKNKMYATTGVNWKKGYNTNYLQNFEKDMFGGINEIVEIKQISGGCNKHGEKLDKKLLGAFYNFELHNPLSMNNNCFFKCLEYKFKQPINIKKIRKDLNLETGSKIDIDDAYKISKYCGFDIQIIDVDVNEELEDDNYILCYNEHYYVVTSYKLKDEKKSSKRGLMTFDFETRPTEEFMLIKSSNTKSYYLKDVLCKAYYKKYKSNEFEHKTFITNNNISSARQFLNYLNDEDKNGRHYNIIAHNGGKFDFYFILSIMTELELVSSKIQMRGNTIIGIKYNNHTFKDSCCFLTNSLENLSKSFKITHGKITKLIINNEEITSSQLCFYKPNLKFNEFLDLQKTDIDFWVNYEKYCLYDCIALYEIWEKFTTCVNSLINKINPYLLRTCSLNGVNTIGSHSKKILDNIHTIKNKNSFVKQDMLKFIDGDKEKYDFICKFKRGGISHCNKMGKHLSGICGVDIASQYPASLIYCRIPVGKSIWIKNYEPSCYGFYKLHNLKFKTNYNLKPLAITKCNGVLEWNTDKIIKDIIYLDSYTIEYLIENYELESFDVIDGLVSQKDISGDKIFGKYINTFYEEKKEQDKLKKNKDEKYNQALRETIKLYLNSLTGKLVENPSIHFSLLLGSAEDHDKKQLNGVNVSKTFNDDKMNEWVTCGVMVYSYSKRLLFEYIRCLPNNSDDVIHIETDGIYFSSRLNDKFIENINNYTGEYPVKFGEDLGNLKIEKTTDEGDVAYFLGKKFYSIMIDNTYLNKERDSNDDNIYRIKGAPQMKLNDDGSKSYLVDIKLYEKIYNGKSVDVEFSTLKKNLWGENINISTHKMKRTINPNGKYNLYI